MVSTDVNYIYRVISYSPWHEEWMLDFWCDNKANYNNPAVWISFRCYLKKGGWFLWKMDSLGYLLGSGEINWENVLDKLDVDSKKEYEVQTHIENIINAHRYYKDTNSLIA